MLILEMIFDICITVLLVFLLGMSSLVKAGLPTKGDVMGPGGFPRVVIILALVLLANQIFKLVKKIISSRGKKEIKKEEVSNKDGYVRLVICVVILFAYVMLMKYLGYALSTFLFVFFFGKVTGYKKNLSLLIFTGVQTVSLVLIFGTLFSISLPRGIGFLKEISFYWY